MTELQKLQYICASYRLKNFQRSTPAMSSALRLCMLTPDMNLTPDTQYKNELIYCTYN